jgi:hypothetical protein
MSCRLMSILVLLVAACGKDAPAAAEPQTPPVDPTAPPADCTCTPAIQSLSWTPITPEAGWNADAEAAYTIDPYGFVRLKGSVLGTESAKALVAQIPEGFRPASLVEFPVVMVSSEHRGTFLIATISDDGDVEVWSMYAFAAGDRVFFDGISFLSRI